jgi:Photosynthetic reaction centre cytochrome C subunit
MNDRVRSGGIFAGATLAFGILVLFGPPKDTAHASEVQKAEGQNAAKEGKTAGEKFKNVQVLKDIPADQLLPSMRYIIASLGVGCDYCHDAQHFDNDDKPTKQRARNMMKMMFAINSDNFNGRREVTCYTCHRGAAKAASVAVLSNSVVGATSAGGDAPATADAGAKPASSPGNAGIALPNAEEVLAKYVQAIGGSGAIQKLSTRIERGSVRARTICTRRWKPTAKLRTRRCSVACVNWGRRANGQVT